MSAPALGSQTIKLSQTQLLHEWKFSPSPIGLNCGWAKKYNAIATSDDVVRGRYNAWLVLKVQLKQTLFLQIFGFVALIEQKEKDKNDNLCKIHGGLYIASALMSV